MSVDSLLHWRQVDDNAVEQITLLGSDGYPVIGACAGRDVVISFDTEFDGPAPSRHSLREIAMDVYDMKTAERLTFWRVAITARTNCNKCFETMCTACKDHFSVAPEPRCMNEFWSHHQDKLDKLNNEGVSIDIAMSEFERKLYSIQTVSKSYVLIACPAVTDWMHVKDNLHRCKFDANGQVKPDFIDTEVLSYQCHCMSSEMRCIAKVLGIKTSVLRKVCATDTAEHMQAHYALEDARAQAITYLNLQRIIQDIVAWYEYFDDEANKECVAQ